MVTDTDLGLHWDFLTHTDLDFSGINHVMISFRKVFHDAFCAKRMRQTHECRAPNSAECGNTVLKSSFFYSSADPEEVRRSDCQIHERLVEIMSSAQQELTACVTHPILNRIDRSK